ncbi:hypothetical protein G7Y89_g9398 [Cudoniella acicularis]|uniref:C2H2-type domain-containing protein n=1 Tax=Cudoniella acicularis TaxID=354080 RepID=A0A8H4RGY6_9HELO|nr:hypothetical protein G7Y89_g9398 [Cudoniella acicularis]
MAMPNKRQAKGVQKIKCEYFGCAVTFGLNSERRRHIREQHGPLIYCCIPGCEWTTRRMGRLRTHLDNAHRSEGIFNSSSDLALRSSSLTQSTANTNRTLPSEFRTATAQSLASPNHLSTPDANFSLKLAPTTPPISIESTFTPQFPPEVSESHAALNGEGASPPKYSPTSSSSGASRMRVQATPYRIFKRCRLRRRKLCPTVRTSSAGPPPTHQSSAMDLTPDFYSSGNDNPTAFKQWMSCTFDVEPITSFLGSLSLDHSIN